MPTLLNAMNTALLACRFVRAVLAAVAAAVALLGSPGPSDAAVLDSIDDEAWFVIVLKGREHIAFADRTGKV
ncbi:MAG TPA: hypothetical protein VNO52_02920, partial [Methylomirabilota bacterium]|nr:hypothetical protein [Methylomirabilota bacterium]